ncbi:MAG: SRPBCC family protein [Gaiellales bacterium]
MKPLYSVERVYDVPIDVLWSAWADASELEQWYAPADLAVVPGSVVSEPTVGGRWATGVAVPAHGFNAWFWGRYTEVVEGQRLCHTLSYSQDEAELIARDDDAPSHDIELDVEDRGSASWVRFTQIGEMPAEQIDATRQGMESYFDSLERHLAARGATA